MVQHFRLQFVYTLPRALRALLCGRCYNPSILFAIFFLNPEVVLEKSAMVVFCAKFKVPTDG